MDERGFDEFYHSTRHRVVAFLYAMCGDREEAQDVAQEAYERAWRRWSTLASYDQPEAWVRKVGLRLSISRWHRARNRFSAYRRHGADSSTEPPSENSVVVVAALRRLPAELRLVTTLYYLLDLPVAEVARQTGTPVNTVKARLVRARAILADLLGAELNEELHNA